MRPTLTPVLAGICLAATLVVLLDRPSGRPARASELRGVIGLQCADDWVTRAGGRERPAQPSGAGLRDREAARACLAAARRVL